MTPVQVFLFIYMMVPCLASSSSGGLVPDPPPGEKGLSNTICRYPCILQHGCECEDNCELSKSEWTDHQQYGICSPGKCSAGWSGDYCQDDVTVCWNSGQLVNGSVGEYCICPPGYYGSQCQHMDCLHTKGGEGPYHITKRPPYPSGNGQCDNCIGGWHGVNCDMCTFDTDCPGNNATCNTTLIPSADQSDFECQLSGASVYLLDVLCDGRTGCEAHIKFNITKPSGFHNNLQDGSGSMTFWRTEPKKVFMDPFFYCKLDQCSAIVGNKVARTMEEQTNERFKGSQPPRPTEKIVSYYTHPPPEKVQHLERVLAYLIMASLVFLIGLAFVPSRLTPMKKKAWVLLSCILLTQLVVELSYLPREYLSYRAENITVIDQADIGRVYDPASVDENDTGYGAATFEEVSKQIQSVKAKQGSTVHAEGLSVKYDCKAQCGCAANPPNPAWQYQCIGSYFDHHFVQATTGITLLCDETGADCTWDSNAYNLPLPATCKSGMCHGPSQEPPHTSGESDSSSSAKSERAVSWSDGSKASAESTDESHAGSGKSGPSDPQASTGATDIVLGVAGALIALIVAHWFLDQLGIRGKKRIFLQNFSSTSDPTETSGLLDSLPESMATARPDSAPLLQDEEIAVLQLEDITYRVSNRLILNGVSCHVESGSTVALMGPSGAGKTTLLDLTAMRTKEGTITGSVRLNGEEISRTRGNLDSYRHLIGYVAQEDTLTPSLTVRQTITYAARLKLPAPLSMNVIEELVDDTIDRLYLRRCQHTQIGDGSRRGISGGEKRRVSIATELLGNPRLLVLDEPTSGLDSVSAFEVIRAITGAAKKVQMRQHRNFFKFRPIVIFSIHQPSESIFRMFDQVCLLQEGMMMYFGPASSALDRLQRSLARSLLKTGGSSVVTAELNEDFKAPPSVGSRAGSIDPRTSFHHDEDVAASPKHFTNQAEALLMLTHRIGQGAEGADLHAISRAALEMQQNDFCVFASKKAKKQNESPTVKEMERIAIYFRPSSWQQLGILASRTLSGLIGSYYLIAAHAFFVLFLGLLIPELYHHMGLDLTGVENRAGMFTFLLLLVGFSTLSAIELFIAERRLFEVEYGNGYYSVLPYFTVKVLFDFIPLRIIPTAILASIIYYPMGLRVDDGKHFLWFVEIITVYGLATTSISFIIAIIAPAFGPAALFASLLALWNTAFGGLLIQSSSVPPFFLPFRYFSPVFYGFESLMINELSGQTTELTPLNKAGKKEAFSFQFEGTQMLYNLGLNPTRFDRDILVIHVEVIALVTIAFITLVLRANISKIQVCSRG